MKVGEMINVTKEPKYLIVKLKSKICNCAEKKDKMIYEVALRINQGKP
jgi:hypothetical protein